MYLLFYEVETDAKQIQKITLLLDLKRSDWLPPYNDEHVKGIIEEISLHLELINFVNYVPKPLSLPLI